MSGKIAHCFQTDLQFADVKFSIHGMWDHKAGPSMQEAVRIDFRGTGERYLMTFYYLM